MNRMNRLFRLLLTITICLGLIMAGSRIEGVTGKDYSQVRAEEESSDTEEATEAPPATTEAPPSTTAAPPEPTTEAPKEETPEEEPSQPSDGSDQDTDSGRDSGKEDGKTSRDDGKEDPASENGKEKEDDKKSNIRSKAREEIVAKEVRKLGREISKDAPEGKADKKSFIPKLYNDTRLSMKSNKEYIAGFVYFNQGDSAWNQNGYCIAKAGCGPTSMAVVITSLTGRWVTPIDTAIWGYQHGYYSAAGSVHAMIPNMAAAYGLDCQGLGRDYEAIRSALKKHHPVVALMGPGYFTRGGHFMVLVAIDKDDHVTVADVGSRRRSAYKYHLSDIISQSKSSAGAGGPFWEMSYEKAEKQKKSRTIRDYMRDEIKEEFTKKSYINLRGNLMEDHAQEEKAQVTIRKVVEVLKPRSGSGEDGLAALRKTPTLFSAMDAREITVTVDAATGDALTADEIIDAGAGPLPENISMGIKLKQDIADRMWHKRLDSRMMDALSAYMEGTIPELGKGR